VGSAQLAVKQQRQLDLPAEFAHIGRCLASRFAIWEAEHDSPADSAGNFGHQGPCEVCRRL
jgi:hypothetical protein